MIFQKSRGQSRCNSRQPQPLVGEEGLVVVVAAVLSRAAQPIPRALALEVASGEWIQALIQA